MKWGRASHTLGCFGLSSEEDILTREEWHTAHNVMMRDSLPPIALWLGLLHVVFAVNHPFFVPRHAIVPMVITAASTAVLLLACHVALRRWVLPPRWAHPCAALIIGLPLLNSLLHLSLTEQLEQTSNIMLILLGIGFLFLSFRWMVVMLALTWLSWAWVSLRLPPSPLWDHYAFGIISATVVGLMVHAVRVQALDRLTLLRYQDARRQQELQAAVEAARQNEARFEKIFRASPYPILFSALDDGRYLDVNDSFTDLSGFTREEAVGRTSVELGIWSAEEQAKFRQALMAQGGRLRGYEAEVRKKSGETAVILASSDVIELDGRSCLLTVVEDITARKHTEMERDALIAELDAFAQTVAHDLKSPLSATLGLLTVLVEDSGEMAPQDVTDYLQMALYGASKMNTIVDELLLLAQMRQGEIRLEPVEMGTIVNEAIQRLAYLIGEIGEVEISMPDHWPLVLGYAPWLEEVWINYLSNAIKYGGRPPRITLGAETDSQGMVRFWIRDNGRGLTPEEQAKLFSPFTQIHRVATKGYGLGLSIVRRIVERLGGTVGVESTPGQGSTFSFTLPAYVPDGAE